jgi:hypothetical protein
MARKNSTGSENRGCGPSELERRDGAGRHRDEQGRETDVGPSCRARGRRRIHHLRTVAMDERAREQQPAWLGDEQKHEIWQGRGYRWRWRGDGARCQQPLEQEMTGSAGEEAELG